jgi:hypothetical protein
VCSGYFTLCDRIVAIIFFCFHCNLIKETPEVILREEVQQGQVRGSYGMHKNEENASEHMFPIKLFLLDSINP